MGLHASMGVHCYRRSSSRGGPFRSSIRSVTKLSQAARARNAELESVVGPNLKKELDATNQARTEREGALEEANSEIEKRQSEIVRLSADVERLNSELEKALYLAKKTDAPNQQGDFGVGAPRWLAAAIDRTVTDASRNDRISFLPKWSASSRLGLPLSPHGRPMLSGANLSQVKQLGRKQDSPPREGSEDFSEAEIRGRQRGF